MSVYGSICSRFTNMGYLTVKKILPVWNSCFLFFSLHCLSACISQQASCLPLSIISKHSTEFQLNSFIHVNRSNGPGELHGISFHELVRNIEKLFLELFIQWLIQENVLVPALLTFYSRLFYLVLCLSLLFIFYIFYMAFATTVMRLCYFIFC